MRDNVGQAVQGVVDVIGRNPVRQRQVRPVADVVIEICRQRIDAIANSLQAVIVVISVGRGSGRRGHIRAVANAIVTVADRLAVRLDDACHPVERVIIVGGDAATVGHRLALTIWRVAIRDILPIEILHRRDAIQAVEGGGEVVRIRNPGTI